jgi:uncharacterized iron-regulated membrane protein
MRKWALLLHRWVGLGLGGLVAVLGVTGSALVYEEEIDAALNPALLRVEPPAVARSAAEIQGSDGPGARSRAPTAARPPGRVSPGGALSRVRREMPSFRAAYLELPGGPREPYVWHGERTGAGGGGLEVFVDPYRNAVLGTRAEGVGVVGVLFRLHTRLMAGTAGGLAVGILGLVLLGLCVTGLVVWWPRVLRWRRFLDAILVRWSTSGRRTNYDLHRAGGAWTLLYLAVLGLTGAGLIFYGTAGELLNAATGSRPMPGPPESSPPAATETGQVAPGTLDEAWGRARRALPEATFTYVTLPRKPEDPLAFRARMPGELHPNGRSHVWFDAWSGRRIRVDDASQADVGPRLLHALYPVHIGTFSLGPLGIPAIRAMWALLGLAPAMLMVTGFLVWWWRRGNGSRERARSAGTRRSDSGPDADGAAARATGAGDEERVPARAG